MNSSNFFSTDSVRCFRDCFFAVKRGMAGSRDGQRQRKRSKRASKWAKILFRKKFKRVLYAGVLPDTVRRNAFLLLFAPQPCKQLLALSAVSPVLLSSCSPFLYKIMCVRARAPLSPPEHLKTVKFINFFS